MLGFGTAAVNENLQLLYDAVEIFFTMLRNSSVHFVDRRKWKRPTLLAGTNAGAIFCPFEKVAHALDLQNSALSIYYKVSS